MLVLAGSAGQGGECILYDNGQEIIPWYSYLSMSKYPDRMEIYPNASGAITTSNQYNIYTSTNPKVDSKGFTKLQLTIDSEIAGGEAYMSIDATDPGGYIAEAFRFGGGIDLVFEFDIAGRTLFHMRISFSVPIQAPTGRIKIKKIAIV